MGWGRVVNRHTVAQGYPLDSEAVRLQCDPMGDVYSFGEWIKQRRLQLRLTQREVAARAFCSTAMVKKMEADERQPSPELAESLATALDIAAEDQARFIAVARGERPVDHLTPGPEVAEKFVASVPTPLPEGTVTFLLTDIEQSTRLWEEQPDVMREALARHDAVLREIIEGHGGHVVKTTGDGCHAVFRAAPDAARAAIEAQRRLRTETGLDVRMALHTGTAQRRQGDYYGPALNRVARVMDVGHGGQILLTSATTLLVRNHLPDDATLSNLGQHRLKDLSGSEEIFQLTAGSLPSDFPPLHSQAVSRLPLPGTPFVGRERDLAEVAALLQREEVRLVTLLGPGGMGKTRLALEAARANQVAFEDGAIFVPLAAVDDMEQLPQAIAQEMQAQLVGSEPAAAQLQRVLRRRHMLLVLDNFEQLAQGAAFLSELSASAPGLKLLVTTRERLNLAEEWLFVVPALDEASALFAQSARRVKADFDAAAEEEAVARICRLVGGHPLAIELAASWRRFMPCADIAARIEQDIDFLASGPRNAPERHRSMRALFDHSWALLSPQEQVALAKLSVFRGGFAAEQAGEVAGAGWPLLLGLVDKSLLQTDGDGRFHLHELTRQYAAFRLEASGQLAATRRAHFASFLNLVEAMLREYTGPRGVASVHRIEQEHENLRAALTWGLEFREPDGVLQLANHIFLFWLADGNWREGEQWLKKAIAVAGDDETTSLSAALTHLSIYIALQGRFAEAHDLAGRGYDMARRLEDPWAVMIALQLQGQAQMDMEIGLAAYEEAIAICREHAGDPRFDPYRFSLLHLQGDRLLAAGRRAEARASYEACLQGLRARGERNRIAYPLGNLGRMALQEGRLQEASDLIGESVSIARESGNRVTMGDWLYRLGQVQLYSGDHEAAEANLRETLRIYEEVGNRFGPPTVLSNLALSALARNDVQTATVLMRDCFSRFRALESNARQVGQHYNLPQFSDAIGLLQFADAIESLLHAGLVAHARGAWQTALAHFAFAEANMQRYPVLKPLQNKVAETKAAIQAAVSADAYAAAVASSTSVALDGLLTVWLD